MRKTETVVTITCDLCGKEVGDILKTVTHTKTEGYVGSVGKILDNTDLCEQCVTKINDSTEDCIASIKEEE